MVQLRFPSPNRNKNIDSSKNNTETRGRTRLRFPSPKRNTETHGKTGFRFPSPNRNKDNSTGDKTGLRFPSPNRNKDISTGDKTGLRFPSPNRNKDNSTRGKTGFRFPSPNRNKKSSSSNKETSTGGLQKAFGGLRIGKSQGDKNSRKVNDSASPPDLRSVDSGGTDATDESSYTSRSSPRRKMSDQDEAMAAADKEMEERANRAKELLSSRYRGLRHEQEAKHARKMQLERQMIGLPEEKKQTLRAVLEQEEVQVQKESRKKVTTADFESLAVIGRGAFGEVRLVRRKPSSKNDPNRGQIYALKAMKKEMMVLKNQVGHVKAERDVLATADDNNRWLTVLYFSFQDETHLYMVMEYMPGGDLMSLLMKEDTFSEEVTKFYMAEAAHAISSVHALGYIHRDIKPDNMLLDARGHLKLTDLGLCKKVGEVSPGDHPEVVLEMLRGQGRTGQAEKLSAEWQGGAAGGSVHRGHGEVMAMSIDGSPGVEVGIGGQTRPQFPTGKARREMAYSTVGTPDYIAPEVLAAQNGASGYSYTCAVDWWSLGVIMYECLVGYTPFYAEDPVTTCRKILRWRQCLEIPAEIKGQLANECIDFLSCLLAGPESRIGSQRNGTTEFENGFRQVIQHPWFVGFDWEGLHERDGPLLPSGAREFPELLEFLKTCPKSDPRFKQLIARVTQNFDTFEDYGSNLDTEGRKRVDVNSLDQFYDYHYRRIRKPRVPVPEFAG